MYEANTCNYYYITIINSVKYLQETLTNSSVQNYIFSV